MISKVKSVQATGTWDNKHGTMYKYMYTFEDGIVLTANHKKEGGNFQIGAEVEYEVKNEHPEYGKSGTVKKPETSTYNASGVNGGGNDVQRMIVRQNALGHAVNIILHNTIQPKTIDPIEVVELAGRIAKWVMQPETKEPTPQPEKVQEVVQDSGIGE